MAKSKYTGHRGVPGDWLIFCARGHVCWASNAVKKWDGQWVCQEHYESQPALERLAAHGEDYQDIPYGRGRDKAIEKEFVAGVCRHHSAVAGVALAGCAIVGRSGVPATGTHVSPDASKPSTFTLDTGTVSLG